ncbi:hypothetical protein MIND_00115800 [Mycena indigotica]|uniref:Uncharacterized protein n=1 Tax=Mycena indigotica TaxID=2126181 RepID=A0A8H6TFX8_9AGAR|nr:uncharacterized protein MIND_00115800 [Mycena indigotica]KAF7315987.1 hypothetical protein MIND_00115800 [Mycena indigotica]
MSSYFARAPRRFAGGGKQASSSCNSGPASGSHPADPTATAAQRVSDSIDEDIRKAAAAQQGGATQAIIILGQAESGKSTLQKQFQLYYASQTLDADRPSWRIVVYANLIKAVRTIVEELEYDFSQAYEEYPWPGPIDAGAENEFHTLRRDLLPLISLESSLTAQLSDGISFVGKRSASLFTTKQGLTRLTGTRPLGVLLDAPAAVVATNRAGQVLGMSVGAIEALWGHRMVQGLLRTRKLRLEESGSFFLGEVHRIAQPDYVPTTDDVLRVRLQTIGVVEHSIPVKTAGGTHLWKIYDVGGVLSQRAAWASYFDDVNALIFVAAISAFDQYLEEDPLTNRISDSLQLLAIICANPLLKNAQLVLLLNKTDILRRKLEAGIQIRDYIISYGSRTNNFYTATEYFRSHFLSAHKKRETFKRTLFVHLTSLVDVAGTQSVIASVQDTIIRKHVVRSKLM